MLLFVQKSLACHMRILESAQIDRSELHCHRLLPAEEIDASKMKELWPLLKRTSVYDWLKGIDAARASS